MSAALCDRRRGAELDYVHCGSRVCLVSLHTKCTSFTKLRGRSVAVSHSVVNLVGKLKLLRDPQPCMLGLRGRCCDAVRAAFGQTLKNIPL